MNFNTVEFAFIYLPIVLLAFYLAPMRLRLPLLAVASMVFYGFSGTPQLVAMLIAITWGLIAGLVLARIGRSGWRTALAVSVPLLILYLFKYLDFTLTSIDASEEVRSHFSTVLAIVLPAGISFYTFQIVAYIIDVADRKVEPETNFVQLLTYVAFFPQLIAGPIVRYTDIRDQLTALRTEKKIANDLARGVKFIAVGMFAKVFFADLPYAFTHGGYEVVYAVSTETSATGALLRIFTYSFQIYYDFWAYSLIAIGLGHLFGISLPRNFLEPYLAPNPRLFWRRWHVTLSFWLKDYVYLKLGGNDAYVRNIIIVFALCGLWHGAGWNFVVWGLYHAALVLMYHALQRPWDWLPTSLQVALTFILVSFGWPLFFLDLSAYGQLLAIVSQLDFTAPTIYGAPFVIYLLVVGAFTFATREDRWLFNETRVAVIDLPATQAGLVLVAIIFLSFSRTFIYFRF
jgi:alginate O-acetyltransferase complex protein AlgI